MSRSLKDTSGEELTGNVTKLRGPEMESYLKEHPTVLYRYTPNSNGLIFLAVLALLAGGAAALVWFLWGMQSLWHGLVIGTLVGAALLLAVLVWYWTYYTRIHYLATSSKHLIIGKGKRVIAIKWACLSAESLGFADDDDDDEQFQGVLRLQLDDYRGKVRLFNVFAWLDNLQGFMSTLLTEIYGKSEP